MVHDFFLTFFRRLLKTIDIITQQSRIDSKRTSKLRHINFFMSQEETLHGTWFSIRILKALEADILIQITPMNTTHTDGIMTTLFLRSLSEFRIPKQRLLVLLSLFVLAVNIIGVKPNLNDFHNPSSL